MSDRVALTDGSGHWFDRDSAVKFDEDTWWNGSNRISRATGSQWNHETLYYTASGRWILRCWSQCEGTPATVEAVDQAEAVQWLASNAHFEGEAFEQLPGAVADAVRAGLAELEL